MESIKRYLDLESFEVFPWCESFNTDYEFIDKQHRKLAEILNDLTIKLVINEKVEIEKTFTQLKNYADLHFADEEKFWKKYLPDNICDDHKKEHESFLPMVMNIEKNNSNNLSGELESLTSFLIRWLSLHIADSDKRMAIMVDAMKEGTNAEEAKKISDEQMGGSKAVFIETLVNMYERLSVGALYILHERQSRMAAEKKLIEVNNKLEKMIITDQLTGLFNRRHFNNILDREIRRAKREKRIFTLIMIDVDYFKLYNDNYGHLKGDWALEKVGKELLKACRRPEDYAFRLGGEEFCVITTNLEPEKSMLFSEKIRKNIEELNIVHEFNKAGKNLTISAGVFCKIPGTDDSTESFFNKADSRLYEAKKAGRNRIIGR